MTLEKHEISSPDQSVELAMSDDGAGRAYLLLHGGAGPASFAGLAGVLAQKGRAVTPTHPGFNGRPRPESFKRVSDLADAYVALLDRLDVNDVVVVGNSFGGWIAAEMALRNPSRIAGIVLLNAVGIDVDPSGKPIVDPTTVSPPERAALAFHDPARFSIAPTTPEALAMFAANQAALRVYAGEPFMHDPTLRGRLRDLTVPALVIWGENDRIADIEYGKRLADSMPAARFVPVAKAGHFPQIEQLDEVVGLIEAFAAEAA